MSVIVPCWVIRDEVEPEFEVPECEHDACIPWREDACVEAVYCALKAMCDLDEGHAGAHRFVSPESIVLHFPAVGS